MKTFFKIFTILFVCILTCSCSFNKKEKEITIFYRDDCYFCMQLSAYLDSQDNSVKKHLIIKKYNINEQENRQLFYQKKDELDLSGERIGVPFIIIGENYHVGFNKEKFNKFIYDNLNITLS